MGCRKLISPQSATSDLYHDFAVRRRHGLKTDSFAMTADTSEDLQLVSYTSEDLQLVSYTSKDLQLVAYTSEDSRWT